MDKKISASDEATKTNKSCLVFNKSENYPIMSFIILVAIFFLIYWCISDTFGFKCIFYCIATDICYLILIYILHKYNQYRINRFIENNKSNYAYRIDGKIYELQQGTKEEWIQLKSKEYDFIVLTNQFSINDNGVAYVIRDKSTLSDPDAKIYIDQSCSEEISTFYDQITEIKTGKILTAAELKQFLKAEESNSKYNPITVCFSNGRKKLSFAAPCPETNLAIMDCLSRYVGANRIDSIGENLDVNFTVTREKHEISEHCEQFVMIINNQLLQKLLNENGMLVSHS